ncbi:MAG TPA: SDR family oxidoreductase [Dehalococcoidia bacterium]|jgi:NAD(P)-dependent dehydrogenase (short-subunit alcohol dehydrogenase family)|nr:SDR family oxidoreductase [Dehalococcoidia bacterium]
MAADLTGQVAIVTGGGRGFGQAIAKQLASQGAAVTVTSRTPEQLEETKSAIEAAGGRALAVGADVNSQADWQRVVSDTEAKLGPVTLLVANAALSDPAGPLYEIDPDVWQKTLDTNVMGSVRGARAVLPGMIERRNGRVIIISSGAALAATPYTSPYRVSKLALLRLAEIMALEVKDFGISVFAIHPGVINSTILDSAVRTEEGRRWVPHMAAMVESGKAFTGTENCAACCAFLASGAADGLSGRYLSATEDYEALAARADEIRERELQVMRLTQ